MDNVNSIITPALIGKECPMQSVSLLIVFTLCNLILCCMPPQDPTEQIKIDNFMVQELDGTVNE